MKKTERTSRLAGKILAGDLVALQKKVASGKTLTGSERKIVERAFKESPPANPANTPQRITTQSALADALGVSKQVISHHVKRGAPKQNADGSYNVSAWREHIILNGNIQTTARIERAGYVPAADAGCNTSSIPIVMWFEELTEHLRIAVAESAKKSGVKLSPAQSDMVTLSLWTFCAEHLDAALVRDKLERYFLERDGAEPDGFIPKTEIPKAILALALRVESTTKARRKKSRSA